MTGEEFLAAWLACGLTTGDEITAIRPALSTHLASGSDTAQELVRRKKLTRFQAQQIFQGRGSSLVVGNYVIHDKIGQGGMGQVFRAEHRRMRRVVALKILPRQWVRDAQTIGRFQREVQAVARLNHPHVVAAFDAGEVDGLHYMVMEHVEGRDLTALVRAEGPLPLERACDYVAQAAQGLEYAHRHGVIHRDVKPSNLLLSVEGVVKVLDLGLARFESDAAPAEALTVTGSVMGTVDFMAPEQGVNTKHADARSDVYSLGCTLYYLMTGKATYGGETVVEKILNHRDAPIPSVRDARPDLPAAVDDVLGKMLAKKPGDRFQTAGEVERAMRALAGSAVTPDGRGLSETYVPDRVPSSNPAPVPPAAETPTRSNLSPDAETAGGVSLPFAGFVAAPARRRKKRQPRAPVAWVAGGGLAAALLLAAGAFWMTGDRRAPARNGAPSGLEVGVAQAASPERVPDRSDTADGWDVAPEPEPPMPSPTAAEVTTATPAAPETPSATPTRDPETHRVGTGPGELATLTEAFARVRPGDTILIRHRGPLEFTPVDLTGKTPLTIAGDAKDGVDYWPIVRQAPLDAKATPDPAPALFRGSDLRLTFRKIHLGVGGRLRQPIGAVFDLAAGAIEFDECTVTASPGGTGSDPVGPTYPLVWCRGGGDAPLGLTFRKTVVRGGALRGCLDALNPGPVTVAADAHVWAGGPKAWVTLQEAARPLRLDLNRSTLYGMAGIVSAALVHGPDADAPAPVSIGVARSVLAGPPGNKTPLVSVTASGGTDVRTAGTRLAGWAGGGVVYHQTGPYLDGSGSAGRKEFCERFGLDEADHVEADPMFRVHPGVAELHEITPRDLEARLTRAARKPPRSFDQNVGAKAADVPTTLAGLADRGPASADAGSAPRGVPRTLRVHQKEGPFKSLEAAFAAVRDDEIIEIADGGAYAPERNFDAASARAVLDVDAGIHLTLRAAEDANPVLILRDDLQRGALPTFHGERNPSRDFALYLLRANCRSLTLDGLHFRSAVSGRARHSMLLAATGTIRVTNCSFVNLGAGPPALVGAYDSNRFCHVDGSSHLNEWSGHLTWFENDAFVFPSAASPAGDLRQEEHAVYVNHYVPNGLPRRVVFRNCAVGHNLTMAHVHALHAELAQLTEFLQVEGCTVFGRPLSLGGPRGVGRIDCRDNLVVCAGNPIVTELTGLTELLQANGTGNAVWTSAALDAQSRNSGALRLLPGPPLKSPPQFLGPATAADPLRPFKPKPGQAWARAGADGVAAGVRHEYLPDVPPFKP